MKEGVAGGDSAIPAMSPPPPPPVVMVGGAWCCGDRGPALGFGGTGGGGDWGDFICAAVVPGPPGVGVEPGGGEAGGSAGAGTGACFGGA